MATVINGILEHRLPWRLVLLGVFLVFVVELLGIRSLPFAVGSYLPIAATATIFAGGVVSWLAGLGRKKPESGAESEVNSGSLYASGLIAGGGIFGLFGIVVTLLGDPEFRYHIFKPGMFDFGPRLAPVLSASTGFAVLMFVILAATQFYFARKKMD